MVKLMDGVRQNKKHPETFSIPSRSEKLKIGAGCYVKLGFINPNKDPSPKKPTPISKEHRANERMWVLVQKEVSPRKYEGILHNVPLSFKKKVLKYGDNVVFESRHILDMTLGNKGW